MASCAFAAANPLPGPIELFRDARERVRFVLCLQEDASPVRFELRESDSEKARRSVILELRPDKKGLSLGVFVRRAEPPEKLVSALDLDYWPKEKSPALAGAEGISARTWKGREIPGVLSWDKGRLRIWLEGRLLYHESLSDEGTLNLTVHGKTGVEFRLVGKPGQPADGPYEEVDLSSLVSGGKSAESLKKDGIPFEVWDGGRAMLSLARAGWPEQSGDPGRYNEVYDGGTYFVADERLPLVQVPKADYLAAYLLCYADENPADTNHVTLRMGRRIGGARNDSQVLIKDFGAEVPRTEVDGPSALKVVRIPFAEAFAQDVEGETMDIELTKEIRLARRTPDPNRFRWRPLGPSSGVRVAALTLERSPIQFKVKASEVGALFEQPAEARFEIDLQNITDQPQEYFVKVEAGKGAARSLAGTLSPGQSVSQTVALPALPPGYYPVTVSLGRKPETAPLLVRHTAMGILPADARKYREEAPWGTWDHDGQHFSPQPPEVVGAIMHKLGLRHGMFNAAAEDRKKFGIIKGNHFKVGAGFKNPAEAALAYDETREKHPDLLPEALIFHEDSISGGHASRIPDLFHDHPPYQLNAEEKKRFDEMWQMAVESARALRKDHPEVSLYIGNGPIPLREELLRNHFPAELFDALGNENPSFSRIPETQPPDPIANNSSLWMDRQLLDAYGYGDKAVTQAHETIYPSSSPGNLSYQTQADYFVRNILHSMAWKMPRIRPGSIADAGNSYYYSNWGATGFMTRRPDVVPKPAAIAMATLTAELDGAQYEGFSDTGSESAYLMRFRKKDGSGVLPFWVVRGEREYSLSIKGAPKVRVISPQGVATEYVADQGPVKLVASASPSWLELPPGAEVKEISLGRPNYPDSDPTGKVSPLASMDTLDGWTIGKERNALLEYYNLMTPRRLGDFSFEPVKEFEGRAGIEVRPRPLKSGKETMPMYAELIRETPIPLPGKPSEIGIWINGNSAWGRVIFELEDASGQRWTSIGAKARSGSVWMADWLGGELAANYTPGDIADWNTDDAWGLSRINFDGWRYVGFPLPGQYPGEGHTWPANSQWNWNKDGVVHYPLALKKVIVELPEKTLHLTEYKPARRQAIYLGDLVSVERDTDAPKLAPGDYVEAAQITVD